MKKTNVLFLIDKPADQFTGKEEQIEGGEVFAYFPNEKWGGVTGQLNTSYAHIGQHGACHPLYAESCQEATPEQYIDLLKELIEIGYTNLNIIIREPA